MADEGASQYLDVRTATAVAWSGDSRAVLVSSDVDGSRELYRIDLRTRADGLMADAGEPRQLTALGQRVAGTFLGPLSAEGGGRRLLLALDAGEGVERHQLYTASDAPTAPYESVADLRPLLVDHERTHRPGGLTRDGRCLAYAADRPDGRGFDTWVIDVETQETRRVFSADGWTVPAGFSPDGRFLAVRELTPLASDNRLYLVDLSALGADSANPSHPAATQVAPHSGEASVGSPSWLPNASAFLFSTDVDREFMSVARGTPQGGWEYLRETRWDTGCAVDRHGRRALVTWNEDGLSRGELCEPSTLAPIRPLELPGAGVATDFRFSPDGRHIMCSYSSARVPGDVWCFDTYTGQGRRLTSSPTQLDLSRTQEPRLIRFRSFDGLSVPAFVYRPSGGDGPFPVLVDIHGGPEGQAMPSFGVLAQYLVAHGFAVVRPNIRGSTGYGRTYQHLDDRERRADAIEDLEALHCWLTGQPDLDESRAALHGVSYGGYVALAALASQPELWRAGASVVGITNLVTFLERTAPWRRAIREREYGSLDRDRDLLLRLSPMTHLDRIAAPVLFVHGANDSRVPLSEAQQMHDALRRRGLDSELVVYQDEGHGLSKPANKADAFTRLLAFLQRAVQDP